MGKVIKSTQPTAPTTDTWDDNDLPVVTATSPKDVDIDPANFREEIAAHESKGLGDYKAFNEDSDALGRYQFVPSYHWDNIKKYTGVKTYKDFLNNPQAQDEWMDHYTQTEVVPWIKQMKEDGTTRGLSDKGLGQLYHFVGKGGAEKYLQTGSYHVPGHNVSIDNYLEERVPVSQSGGTWGDEDLPVVDNGQKKSPDVSVSGSPVSSTPGQNGSPATNGTPQGESQPPATPQPSFLQRQADLIPKNTPPAQVPPQQPVVELPIAPDPLTGLPAEAMTPAVSPQEKTRQATEFIANDYMRQNGAPQGIMVSDPNHPLNQITDPHGDPSYLSGFVKSSIAKIEDQRKQEIDNLNKDVRTDDPTTWHPDEEKAINAKYDQQAKALTDNAGQIMSLQLFNKEVNQRKYDESDANRQMLSLQQSLNKDLKENNDQIEATKNWAHPNGVGAMEERSRLRDRQKDIQNHYGQQMQSVRENTKYNPIMIGAEYAANMGNPQAGKDLEALKQGKGINPASQYAYNQFGNKVIQDGTDATVNEKAKQEGEAHSDRDNSQLYENNKPYIIQQAANTVGNAKYDDTNPLMNAVRMGYPSQILPGTSKEEIQKYGEENGLEQKVIDELKKDPSQIPKQASLPQQFLKGAFNATAPIYETSVRTAGHIFGGNSDAINENFAPGWENQRGVGALIAGNTPTEQNSFHNFTGAMGQIFEGAGNLSTFAGEVGGTAKGLEALGMTEKGAEKLANFGVMTLQGYNDSYKNSLELFGDKPEDEGKRQAYSLINGVIGGAIFSVAPKSQLIKNALGEVSKSGEQLVNEIQANGGMDFLHTPTGKEKLQQYVTEFGKEMGTQMSLATAQKISEGVINTVAAPDAKQNMPEDLKNTAVSTFLTMLIPSILGAKGHVDMQSPLNHAAMFEMGSNPDKYINFVSDQLKDGKITPEQAQMSHDAILSMKNVIANTPTHTEDKEGNEVPLSPDQVKKYAYMLFQEGIQQKKLDALKQQAAASNLPVDKAQEAPVKKKVSELQKERDDILANPALPITAPAPERSVAENPQPEEETPATKEIPEEGSVIKWDRYGNEEENDWTVGKRVKTRGGQDAVELSREYEDGGGKSTVTHVVTLEDLQKKSSEKEGNSENKNIPLTPQSETKTTEDESNKGNRKQNSGQNSPNAEEHGQEDPNLKEAGNSEAGSGPQEDRVLSSEEENKAQATPTEQPIPVSGRKRFKFVAENEPIQQKEYAAMDVGTEAGKPEEEVDKKVKAAADDEKIGGGESFNDFKSRIKSAWENTKKTAADKTQFIMHSTVMRLIDAAEKVGWDSPKLREEFNNTEDPRPAEKQTYKLDNGNGEIDLYRHAESQDGKDGLSRTPETPLTPKGEKEAAKIAEDIKDKGIAPPAIVAGGDEVRTGHTAEIVAKELAEKEALDNSDVLRQSHNGQFRFWTAYHKPTKEFAEFKNEKTGEREAKDWVIKKHQEYLAKINQGTEPSTERRNEVKPEPQAPATKTFTKKDIETIADGKGNQKKGAKVLKPEIITKDFKKGDKITFHTDGKERTGTWDGKALVDKDKNKWGITGILSDDKGWIRNDGQQEQPKTKENASAQSKKQQQEGNKQSGKPEHAGVEQAGGKAKAAETKNSDSDQRTEPAGNEGGEIKEADARTETENGKKRLGEIEKQIAQIDNDFDKSKSQDKPLGNLDLLDEKIKLHDEADKINSRLSELRTQTAEGRKEIYLENKEKFKKADDFIKNNEAQMLADKAKLEQLAKEGKKDRDLRKSVRDDEEDLEDAKQQRDEAAKAIKEYEAQEPPNQAKPLNGANAENPKPEGKAPATKELTPEEKEINDIDEKLLRERASQKKEAQLRDEADKKKDLATRNKHHENWYKKQEKIDKLNEQRADAVRNQQIKQEWNERGDKFEANRKKFRENLKDVKRNGYSLPEHVADYINGRIADGIRELGNLHVAIRRAIRLAREKFGKEAEGFDEQKAREFYKKYDKAPEQEPDLPNDQKKYAHDLLADIEAGVDADGKPYTYADAEKEVSEEVILNREGEPVSDAVAEKNKAKILNYIKYHTEPIKDMPEYIADSDGTVSVKNEFTRAMRAKLGLGDEIPADEKHWIDVKANADKEIEKYPDTPKKLVDYLEKHPGTAVTDEQNYIVTHHLRTLNNNLEKLITDINDAGEQGNTAQVLSRQTEMAATLDEIKRTTDVSKAIGSTSGRALASRRMELDRRYDIANMLNEKRASANDGKKLSPEQIAEVQKLHDEIKRTRDELDAYKQKEAAQKAENDLKQKVAAGGKVNKEDATDIDEKTAKKSVIKDRATADNELKDQQEKTKDNTDKGKNVVKKMKERGREKSSKDMDDLKNEALKEMKMKPQDFLKQLRDKIKKGPC